MNTNEHALPEGLDLDTLAAYMDGALSGDDRSRVESLLAHSEAGREVLAEAVRLRADLERSDEPGDVVRLDRRPPSRWKTLRWVPLAAAAAVATVLLTRGGGQPDLARPLPEVLVTAPLDSDPSARLWTRFRGSGEVLTSSHLAFRSGASWTAFVASWTAGSDGSAQLATELLTLLQREPLASGPAVMTRSLRDQAGNGSSTADARAAIEQADELLSVTMTQPWYDWGTHLESIRLAVAAGDRRFLESASLRRAVAELGTEGLTSREREAALAVSQALETDPLDLAALRSALDVAFVALGG